MSARLRLLSTHCGHQCIDQTRDLAPTADCSTETHQSDRKPGRCKNFIIFQNLEKDLSSRLRQFGARIWAGTSVF